MKKLWITITEILKKSYEMAFCARPFHIVSKEVDSLTKEATFSIKAKHVFAVSKLKTKDIIHDDYYLCGLSKNDRRQIEAQYLLELKQPRAYIEEYPINTDKKNQYIFKILLVETKKIVCGSASYFIESDKKILCMLSAIDIVTISMAYYAERFENTEKHISACSGRTKIHYM